jgi:hypothetical protein
MGASGASRQKPSTNSRCRVREHARGLAEAEVAAPSDEVWREVLDQLRQADPPCPAGQVPDPGSLDPPKITLVSLAAVAERAQSLQRTAPSWRAKVPCSGRRRFTDGVLAHVRTPGGPTSPAQPLFRHTRSPPTPCLCPSLTQSNRRGTDPYARWWGRGGIARCRPIPISGQKRSSGRGHRDGSTHGASWRAPYCDAVAASGGRVN